MKVAPNPARSTSFAERASKQPGVTTTSGWASSRRSRSAGLIAGAPFRFRKVLSRAVIPGNPIGTL